jgi:DNA-binding transcriptional regulator YiaG
MLTLAICISQEPLALPPPARHLVYVSTLNMELRQSRARRQLPSPDERRAIRQEAGLSQAALARVLGTSRPTVSKYESGDRLPRADLAVRYQRTLERLRREVAAL